MALILNIDTSTSVCSVALARDGKMIALKENNEGLNHSVLLGTYIDEILKDNHMDAHCLDAVAISMARDRIPDYASEYLWRKEYVSEQVNL